MKKWLMAVLFGTLLVLGACGGGANDNANEPADTNDEGTEEPADDGAADEGGTVDTAAAEDAFQQSCASCHGEDLSGGAGPELTNIGSELSAEDIEGIIENGQGSMPGGLLSGDDATAVAEWLADHK